MSSITEVLKIEHTQLCLLFDELDRLLPEVRTVDEARLLSRLVEGVLSHHANLEENLAFAALDQALAAEGELRQLHQDHKEIDVRLQEASSATALSEAARLLKEGLKASRTHFCWEEQTIFPLFERLFTPASLETLGAGAAGRETGQTLTLNTGSD